MTAGSSMTGEEQLNHPGLWTEFLRCLSHHDPEYDLEIINSFADCIGVPRQKVWEKFRSQVGVRPPPSMN